MKYINYITLLKNLVEQPKEICLEAVKSNGFTIKLVKNQTKNIYLEAIRQNNRVLRYVKIIIDKV